MELMEIGSQQRINEILCLIGVDTQERQRLEIVDQHLKLCHDSEL